MASSLRRPLKAALLISSVLLVSQIWVSAVSIQDSLPSLVLEDGEQAAPAATGAEPKGQQAASGEPQAVAPTTQAAPFEPAASEAAGQPKLATDGASQEATSSSPSSKPEESSAGASELGGKGTGETANTTSQSAATTGEPQRKDINVLLANKDDAENDLAASEAPSTSAPATEATVDKSATTEAAAAGAGKPEESGEKKVSVSNSEAPVDTVSGSGSQNNERFHYSLGGDKFDTTTSAPEPASSVPAASKIDIVVVLESSSTTLAPSTNPPEETKPAEPEQGSKPEGEPEEGKRESEKPDSTTKSPLEAKAEQPEANRTTTTTDKSVDQTQEPATTQTALGNKSSDRPTQSSEPSSTVARGPEVQPSTTAAPVVESTTLVSEKPTEEPSKSPISSTTAVPSDRPKEVSLEGKKPEVGEQVPSILGTALGTALGSAVTNLSKQSTTTTTKAPVVTTKKSSTDRWDKYTPTPVSMSTSSSTSTPPTRRRPILPSIRRRFRPYNRFSPFPWGGADVYSPMHPMAEPDFRPPGAFPDSPFKPNTPATSTAKPKRRISTSSSPSLSDSDEHESGGRRRGSGGNRRHYQHHHRHEHDLNGRRRHGHNHNNNHHRFYNHHHNREHTHDRDEPMGPFDSFPSHFRPHQYSPPGFGLFNTGLIGSGFDLLSPFPSWTEDISPSQSGNKPKVGSPLAPATPGIRPKASGYGGSPASPSDSRHPRPESGEYPAPASEAEPGFNNARDYDHDHHDHDHHEHDHHHDHHHHHREDCHGDSEYNHHHRGREPHRPPPGDHQGRPIGPAREPYRPYGGQDGYDTYPPSRPGRPYNRRDQAHREVSETADSHPSLYNSGPAAQTTEKPAGGSGNKPAQGELESQGSGQPNRRPSILSPFDALFGNFDDDISRLRSSFMGESPLFHHKDSILDTIVSSPKISMPSMVAASSQASNSSPATRASEPVSIDDKAKEAEHNNGKMTDSSLIDDNGEVNLIGRQQRRAAINSPCSGPASGILCLFNQKPPSLFDLFHI